ncbi:MAG: 2-succinylbenzoate--CoA ligase [Cyanobacteria bacterium P01_A01_bin.135]
MVSPLAAYQRCRDTAWLRSQGDLASPFNAAFERRYHQLTQFPGDRPAVMLAEREPTLFLASFLAACAANCPIFLANPNWAVAEWQRAMAVGPDLLWRDGEEFCPDRDPNAPRPAPGWIMIPTGGSSGQLKFAIHTWDTLSASVQGFREYFGLGAVNACCTLPLYHVSGLMQFLRCLQSGGELALWPWRSLEALPFSPEDYFLSLVPSQLQALILQPAALKVLQRFRAVLLGGAPAWPALLAQGRLHQLPLAPTYGMTETASQVATLKPEQFLAGQMGCGQVLPHAQITTVDEAREPAPQGQLRIAARSLYLGYYPQAAYPNSLLTDDVGQLTHDGLQILGRQSDKIISGGENIFPAEVEAAIRATGLVADVAVIGVAHPHWGETPVALYVPKAETVTYLAIVALLKPYLARYKCPNRWIALERLPRNPQGKLDRTALRALATEPQLDYRLAPQRPASS